MTIPHATPPSWIPYVRISPDARHGEDGQLVAIEAYCSTHGLPLGEPAIDVEFGAGNGEGLEAAVARVEAGQAAGIVCCSLDRIARTEVAAQRITKRVRRANGDIIFVR